MVGNRISGFGRRWAFWGRWGLLCGGRRHLGPCLGFGCGVADGIGQRECVVTIKETLCDPDT